MMPGNVIHWESRADLTGSPNILSGGHKVNTYNNVTILRVLVHVQFLDSGSIFPLFC